ncbi:MAG: hypothetical protein LBS19_13400, partial [Clostridiales bacterium]|nr:hypothetical protein [Clostridiales bacterium]
MKKLLLSALICVLLTGCVSMRPFPSSLSAQDKIASYLENLCSEEFAGRLPGTPGNDLAAEWLSDRLDEWDIEPYAGGSYFVGYPGRVNEFIRSEITLTDASGVSRELVRGEDFIIGQAMGNFETVIEADSENYELVKDGGRLNLNARSGVSGTYVVFNEREFSGGSNSYVPNQPARSTVLVSVSEEFGDIIGSGDFERIEIVN